MNFKEIGTIFWFSYFLLLGCFTGIVNAFKPLTILNGTVKATEPDKCIQTCILNNTSLKIPKNATHFTDSQIKDIMSDRFKIELCKCKTRNHFPLFYVTTEAFRSCDNSGGKGVWKGEVDKAYKKDGKCLGSDTNESCEDYVKYIDCVQKHIPSCKNQFEQILRPAMYMANCYESETSAAAATDAATSAAISDAETIPETTTTSATTRTTNDTDAPLPETKNDANELKVFQWFTPSQQYNKFIVEHLATPGSEIPSFFHIFIVMWQTGVLDGHFVLVIFFLAVLLLIEYCFYCARKEFNDVISIMDELPCRHLLVFLLTCLGYYNFLLFVDYYNLINIDTEAEMRGFQAHVDQTRKWLLHQHELLLSEDSFEAIRENAELEMHNMYTFMVFSQKVITPYMIDQPLNNTVWANILSTLYNGCTLKAESLTLHLDNPKQSPTYDADVIKMKGFLENELLDAYMMVFKKMIIEISPFFRYGSTCLIGLLTLLTVFLSIFTVYCLIFNMGGLQESLKNEKVSKRIHLILLAIAVFLGIVALTTVGGKAHIYFAKLNRRIVYHDEDFKVFLSDLKVGKGNTLLNVGCNQPDSQLRRAMYHSTEDENLKSIYDRVPSVSKENYKLWSSSCLTKGYDDNYKNSKNRQYAPSKADYLKSKNVFLAPLKRADMALKKSKAQIGCGQLIKFHVQMGRKVEKYFIKPLDIIETAFFWQIYYSFWILVLVQVVIGIIRSRHEDVYEDVVQMFVENDLDRALFLHDL